MFHRINDPCYSQNVWLNGRNAPGNAMGSSMDVFCKMKMAKKRVFISVERLSDPFSVVNKQRATFVTLAKKVNRQFTMNYGCKETGLLPGTTVFRIIANPFARTNGGFTNSREIEA